MRNYDVEPLAGYHPEIGLMAAILQDGAREWQEELHDGPSEDAIVWQPAPGSHSIGAILLHMMEAETYWIEQICLGRPEDPQEMAELHSEGNNVENDWVTPPRKPWSYYMDLYRRYRARTLESLKTLNPSKIKEHHQNTATFRWVFSHVVQHDSYHGGQIVLLNELHRRMHGDS